MNVRIFTAICFHIHQCTYIYSYMFSYTPMYVYLQLYVFIYTNVRIFTAICFHIHQCTYIYSYMFSYTPMYVYLQLYVFIYTNVRIFTAICFHIHQCTYIYSYMFSYTPMYVYLQLYVFIYTNVRIFSVPTLTRFEGVTCTASSDYTNTNCKNAVNPVNEQLAWASDNEGTSASITADLGAVKIVWKMEIKIACAQAAKDKVKEVKVEFDDGTFQTVTTLHLRWEGRAITLIYDGGSWKMTTKPHRDRQVILGI